MHIVTRSLLDGASMFWQTLWALVLGFGLSGAVQFGAGQEYAQDPVCGMQVQVAHAPATARYHGQAFRFCSDHCQHRFTDDPARYAAPETTVKR